MPRQSKRFKLTMDDGDNEALADVEEETSECADSEDEEATDEDESDDYMIVKIWDEAEMDWEDDESEPEPVDQLPKDLETASE